MAPKAPIVITNIEMNPAISFLFILFFLTVFDSGFSFLLTNLMDGILVLS